MEACSEWSDDYECWQETCDAGWCLTYERFGEEWTEQSCSSENDDEWFDDQDECDYTCSYFECDKGDYCLVENCVSECGPSCYQYVQTGEDWQAFECEEDDWQTEECFTETCDVAGWTDCAIERCFIGETYTECLMTATYENQKLEHECPSHYWDWYANNTGCFLEPCAEMADDHECWQETCDAGWCMHYERFG